jgi:hypothetical protein
MHRKITFINSRGSIMDEAVKQDGSGSGDGSGDGSGSGYDMYTQ